MNEGPIIQPATHGQAQHQWDREGDSMYHSKSGESSKSCEQNNINLPWRQRWSTMISSKREVAHTIQKYLAFKPLPNVTPDYLSFLMSALLYNSIELQYKGPMRSTCDVAERDIPGPESCYFLHDTLVSLPMWAKNHLCDPGKTIFLAGSIISFLTWGNGLQGP